MSPVDEAGCLGVGLFGSPLQGGKEGFFLL